MNAQSSSSTYRKKIRPIRRLAHKALRELQQAVLKVEQLAAAGIGEDLPARDGHDFTLAFTDFVPVDVGDAEVVACDGTPHQALFFHLQCYGLGVAEFGEDAEGWVEGLECHFVARGGTLG